VTPNLLYGTAWKKQQTASLVTAAIKLGFRGIDTACQPKHYNEPGVGVGAGIAACLDGALTRADLYIQTKFTSLSGQDPKQVPYNAKSSIPSQVEQSFRASLGNLQTNYLDCLVLHSPMNTVAQTMEVWRAMEAIVDSGGARQLGISNCYDVEDLKALDRLARVKPAVVQNRFYAETHYDREIRAFCGGRGIVYQSFWTLSANPRVLGSEPVKAQAWKHQRTPAQILFRYLTQIGIVPLTGTQSEAHMREDLAIFEFELAQDECAAMAALF
jgi:diketogulonate reductase-like aldo/keto reductase